MYAPALENELAREVRAGLTAAGQKTLPCGLLYDDIGSALFEAITLLPEYGLTRADARIIRAHANELAEMLPRGAVVAELGSGSGVKTRAILEALPTPLYFPIDVSRAALARCVAELGALAAVEPIEATYLEGLGRAAARCAPGQALLALFLGSTIGNFEFDAAADFLTAVRACLRPGDALLLGTDLVKPADRLLPAYDDPAGVTAAFNLNMLARINRELGGNFNLRSFEHVVRWNRGAQRIEMHLRSRVRQRVTVRLANMAVAFEPGETILTEVCHKFRLGQVRRMARAAGFRPAAQWRDLEWPFAESLLVAE
jgi:dimethylhistidine N-methyltransferase